MYSELDNLIKGKLYEVRSSNSMERLSCLM